MEKIRGKSLKEWKKYCKEDKVPLNTMKYIIVLEERLEDINNTHCCTELPSKQKSCVNGIDSDACRYNSVCDYC